MPGKNKEMYSLDWKIGFTGPESSGKTTLANWLAEELKLSVSPEFARSYLAVTPSYSQDTLDFMARRQFSENNKAQICDTELLVFYVWSTEKYGQVSPLIQELLKEQRIHHYFLCAPDIPWEEDPLRENPHDRERLFDCYKNLLEEWRLPFSVLKGSLSERKSMIISQLDKLKNR